MVKQIAVLYGFIWLNLKVADLKSQEIKTLRAI